MINYNYEFKRLYPSLFKNITNVIFNTFILNVKSGFHIKNLKNIKGYPNFCLYFNDEIEKIHSLFKSSLPRITIENVSLFIYINY